MTAVQDLAPAQGRPRAAWRSQLSALAAEQDHVATTAQLRQIGVPSSTASGRSRTEGGWTRILPGVHLVSGGRPDRAQRERAALLYAGQWGLLSGTTALRRLGLRWGRLQEVSDDHRNPEVVQVLVPHDHHLQSIGFVEVTRTRRWPDEREVDGLRIVAPCRAVADVARRAGSERQVAPLVDEALRLGLTTVEELMAELREGPRQGSAHLRSVLLQRQAVSRDGLDRLVEVMLVEAGVPDPAWHPVLVAESGQTVGRPWAWVGELGVALELTASDAVSVARHQRYAMHGVVVFPVSPQLLRSDPRGQSQALRAVCEHAGRRPRPRVRAVVGQSSPTVASGLSTPQAISSSASLLTGSS